MAQSPDKPPTASYGFRGCMHMQNRFVVMKTIYGNRELHTV